MPEHHTCHGKKATNSAYNKHDLFIERIENDQGRSQKEQAEGKDIIAVGYLVQHEQESKDQCHDGKSGRSKSSFSHASNMTVVKNSFT